MSDGSRDERDNSDGSRDGSTDDSGSTENGGGRKSDQNNGGGQSRNEQRTTTAEKAVMVVSVLFTLSLITYGGLQMVTTPDGTTPNAAVVETEPLPSGEVAVTIRLTNPGDVGLISTTIAANCSTPQPSVQLTYVPASSTRQGTLVCPPDTTNPNVSVTNWVTA